ncbi:MAG TPA: ATP-binding cassette domain-containing protein, partial [Burkholderiales bacterium]|nr:ATP-binding cassette domain-containing protein [Burkholderiales bacterium]
MSLLSVRDLRVDFGAVQAVKGVTFAIPEHSTVALVGESGSGKSVTALSILGLLPGNATVGGRILFQGKDLLQTPAREMRALRGAEIAMIFQEPMSSLNPVFSVGFQVAEVLRQHRGLSAREARARTLGLFEEVGLASPEAKLDAIPSRLSGGEQQRVMIAMAIACEPKLLIADEPTSALDVTVQKQILELIAALQRRRRMSVLFITHDLALLTHIANHVVVMQQGEIREQGTVEQVFGAPTDDYTRMLLAARPRLDQIVTRKRANHQPTVLEAHALAKSFDGVPAVKGASFKLARGRTLGL